MTLQDISAKAEQIAKEYNPNNISPFPFDEITNQHIDLRIYTVSAQITATLLQITYMLQVAVKHLFPVKK